MLIKASHSATITLAKSTLCFRHKFTENSPVPKGMFSRTRVSSKTTFNHNAFVHFNPPVNDCAKSGSSFPFLGT